MKKYNYTNWKNYLIHLLNEKRISDSEALNLFLNTASQAEVYIALDKGDLVDEREAEKFQDYFTAQTVDYIKRVEEKKNKTLDNSTSLPYNGIIVN